MNSNNGVALAAPLHDPDERILKLIEPTIATLLKLYGGCVSISVTPTTSPKTIEKLKTHGISINLNRADNIGLNYRMAIKTALGFDPVFVHQVDFDRALHWANRYPNELRDIIECLPSYQGFVTFARTKRAFETHPLIQRSVEIAVNAIASEVAKKEVDIMSGSVGFDRNLAEIVVQEGKRQDYGLYAEFLIIALKHKMPIHTIEVEGLEWETPDQFKDKIEKEGYVRWLDEFQSLSEWKKRVKLIEESADALI